MREGDEDGIILVYSENDIPEFKSEREEQNFWNTHAFSEEFMDRAVERAKREEIPLPPVRKRSTSTSLRLDEDTLERLRHLARK